MAKQLYISNDPDLLKPVIEALIFASEEPLPPRLLVRLLAGERDDPKEDAKKGASVADDAGQQPVETTEEIVETAADAVEEGGAMEPAVMDAASQVETTAAIDDTAADNVEESESTSDSVDEPEREEESRGDSERGAEDAAPETEPVDGDADELADAFERAGTRSSGRGSRTAAAQDAIDQRLVRRLVDELNHEYEESGRVFRIVEVAGGFQFATIREYGEFVGLLVREKGRRRLSPAALETLAIIAYRQPVAKPEIESIRGVNCDQVLLSLLEKNLIAITGRSEAVGRPLLYGSTDEFLRCFGLNSIGDLPKLREIEELMEDGAFAPERVEVITVEEGSDAEEIEAMVGAAGLRHEDRETSADASVTAIAGEPERVEPERVEPERVEPERVELNDMTEDEDVPEDDEALTDEGTLDEAPSDADEIVLEDDEPLEDDEMLDDEGDLDADLISDTDESFDGDEPDAEPLDENADDIDEDDLFDEDGDDLENDADDTAEPESESEPRNEDAESALEK